MRPWNLRKTCIDHVQQSLALALRPRGRICVVQMTGRIKTMQQRARPGNAQAQVADQIVPIGLPRRASAKCREQLYYRRNI
eukprot:6026443-Pyramimonas_sp.AAC.1